MKTLFVWNFDKAPQIYDSWNDGHRAAIEEIKKRHEVKEIIGKSTEIPQGYDFYLFWCDATDPLVQKSPGPNGVILTSDNFLEESKHNLVYYDVIYCESQPVYEKVRRLGYRAIKAMGTNTEFYVPDNSKKDIKYFYPATFSPWKRQSFISYYGKDLLCVGTVQPDGEGELKSCKKAGVQIKTGYFPAEEIRDYYRRAENVLVPAIHGSERTVLEALAMNIVPEVNKENIRAYSYIEEYKESGLKPREFVLKYYSEHEFARNLERGML